MAPPSVGDTAPDFEVTDTEGNELVLSTLVESGPVIVAFFPKAFTPGCTREMKSYRDRYAALADKNATIIAVSSDKEARQAAFRAEIGAEFSFVADPRGELIRAFDIKTPLVTFAKRTTFVIGKDRVVLHVESGRSSIDADGAVKACSRW